MELGSEVCRPRSPRCDVCPVAPLCRAKAEGLQLQIPPPKAKPATRAVREAAVVVRRRGRVLLVERPQGGRWAGLWDFPRFPLDGPAAKPQAEGRQLIDGVRRLTGVRVRMGRHLQTYKHGVTRFRITLECYEAEYVSAARGKIQAAAPRWLRPDELDAYPALDHRPEAGAADRGGMKAGTTAVYRNSTRRRISSGSKHSCISNSPRSISPIVPAPSLQ